MGSWFSNLHIRKKREITKDQVLECVKEVMAERNCIPAEDAQDADVVIAVVESPNSQWVSVYSQIFAHDDPDSCKAVAVPMSSRLHTDVLGAACFDSDYLYLNLINTEEAVDAWVGIGAGKELGITRRNNLTAWKKKVAEYPAFSAAAKDTYICADEFMEAAAACLGLPAEQGSASLDYLKDTALEQDAQFLYFRQEEGVRHAGPDLQVCYMRYANPCFDGWENEVSFLNYGDEFCGLSVYFLGPYVEHDEITFSDVKVERFQRPPIALELTKIQLSDGQWAYYCHDPEILMPPGIPCRMKKEKRDQLELDRMRKISFIPHGNPRKMLDVTVVIVPDGNPENRAVWNAWKYHGSKEECIKHHNWIWKRVRAVGEDPDECLPLLKMEDFDE